MLTNGLEDLSKHRVLGEIALNERDIGDRIHRQDIRSDQAPLVPNQTAGNLRPATWRRPQINHRHARTQDAVLLLDLEQLVAGARAIAVLLCHFDVGIIEMFFEPPRARLGACQAVTSSGRVQACRLH